MNHNPNVKAVVDSLLDGLPGVKISKAFGYPAYKVYGKIFAFAGGDGISIKLPEARVKQLVGSQPHFKQFEVTEGVIWRQWLSIEHPDPDSYRDDFALIEESIRYVFSDEK